MKLLKPFVLSSLLLMYGCDSSNDTPETSKTAVENISFSKILDYVENPNATPPTTDDYANAGITGVNPDNIDNVNTIVRQYTVNEIDTVDKLQNVVNTLAIQQPAASSTNQQQTTGAPTTADTEPPVIYLNGSSTVTVPQGATYTDPGARARDNVLGDVTARIIVTGHVDTSKLGVYKITYNVRDDALNWARPVTRTVKVVDVTPPIITLQGKNPYYVLVNTAYTDPGASATDDTDGNISSQIVTDTSAVDTTTAGNYTVVYTVKDSAGNQAQATRTVTVVTTPFIRDNTNNTVTDRIADVMWQDNVDVTTVIKTWADAQAYCTGLTLGGYNNWRTPTSAELSSIYDATTTSHTDSAFVNTVTPLTAADFWTSESAAGNTANAIEFDFNTGQPVADLATNTYPVRCIRDIP